jgi:hypothetical protein
MTTASVRPHGFNVCLKGAKAAMITENGFADDKVIQDSCGLDLTISNPDHATILAICVLLDKRILVKPVTLHSFDADLVQSIISTSNLDVGFNAETGTLL